MKKIMFASAALLTMLFGACVKERPDGWDEKDSSDKLRVSLKFAGNIGYNVSTRVSIDPEPGEDQIANLYLLFFESNPDRNGVFIDFVKIDDPMILANPNGIPIALANSPSLTASGAYHILALANVTDTNRFLGNDGVTAWIAGLEDRTEEQALRDARAWLTEGLAIDAAGLLMSGRVEKALDQYDLDVILTRNVVRFDVINSAEDYTLTSVSICNAYPSSSIWGAGEMDYSGAVSRIRFYHGKDNITGNSATGLYAFENRVVAPIQNDRLTTCLIIGLKDVSNTVHYYRINIAPDDGAQTLKRNNVYRVTIRNVGGGGYVTEDNAYGGSGNDVDYVINTWGLDNDGLIVQDGNSMLSIPSQTVRIPREGGMFNYSIFTFNNSGLSHPLTISRQFYEPANNAITAELQGNQLVVTASALGADTKRTGTVVLSYAGLEATMTIIQSSSDEIFLRLHMPDGLTPRLAPFAGISSGMIRVEASGDWTAKLYMENGGFSFKDDPVAMPLQTITSMDMTDNRFRIFTHSANPLPEIREGFVVVSLDDDPQNHTQMFRIIQDAAGGIEISPKHSRVTFDCMGGFAPLPNNTTTGLFRVLPGTYKNDMHVEEYMDWDFIVEAMPGGVATDVNMFSVTRTKYDLAYPEQSDGGNEIRIEVREQNTSGRNYTARLKLFLKNDPGKFVYLELVQQTVTMDLSPNTFTAIGAVGGKSPLITVQAPATLTWSATLTTNSGTAPDGRTLVHHAATLVDQNGNLIVPGQQYPLTTQFRVVFPKVYYPNRQIPISATVTVTVSNFTRTITVNQTTLTSKGMGAVGFNSGWNGLNQSYNAAYITALRSIPNYSLLRSSWTNVAAPANATYIHVSNDGLAANYNWTNVNNAMNGNGGVLFMGADRTSGASIGAFNSSTSPMKLAGFPNLQTSGNGDATMHTASAGKKVYKFLMGSDETTTGSGTVQISSNPTGFSGDGSSTSLPVAGLPATAVALTSRQSATQAMLVIDPASGIVFLGESTHFNTGVTGSRATFLDNLMFYIGNASKYGSHFTDMFLESDHPNAVAAPWDDYWGNNKGVPTK